MQQSVRSAQPTRQNKRSLRTSSPIIKKILSQRFFDLVLIDATTKEEISGIHLKPGLVEKQRLDASAAAIIEGAHLALQSYRAEGNYKGLANTYCLLAQAEDSSTFAGTVNKANYYRLAGHALKRKIAEDKEHGASMMDSLEDLGFVHEFFSKAGETYRLASLKVDCLDTITELFAKATEMYVQVSDYPVAYDAAANAAEYESNPRVRGIFSSLSDILGSLQRGDKVSLGNIMIVLAASADELAEKERVDEAAHIFAVLAHLEDDDNSKVELLEKAANNYTRLGDYEAAGECHSKAAALAPEEKRSFYLDLASLNFRLSRNAS